MIYKDKYGEWLIENNVKMLTKPSQKWLNEWQPRATEPEKLINIRNVRDKLLRESDYTQISDNPILPSKKQEWIKYRQD